MEWGRDSVRRTAGKRNAEWVSLIRTARRAHFLLQNPILRGYYFRSDELQDAGNVSRVTDANSEDRVWFDGITLASLTLIQTTDNTWRSVNDRLFFTRTSDNLEIQSLESGVPGSGKVIVQNFHNGDLGLTSSPWAMAQTPCSTAKARTA
jgi:hypothetical protein